MSNFSQQQLKRIEIYQLKGLCDLEIDFKEKGLTAILGINGSGKSTILHALACVNSPLASSDSVDYKLSEFFTPTVHSIWTGSSFYVYQDYRIGNKPYQNHKTHFRKETTRWSPRYTTRIERYISFIGIKTCVPIIESENQQSRIKFNTISLGDTISSKVKELAGQVMNRHYTTYNRHITPSKKEYMGVSRDGIDYSSLSMGAGEQRIFYILSQVLKAEDYGLILIDEIDLLLHQDALVRLLDILNKEAIKKKLQIIFTTHAHSITHLDYIDFRHLHQTPNKTLCFNDTKPDALRRLTGENVRPLEVFVEDDLASYLIKKICAEEGIAKYVSTIEFGAASNCFTTVSGCILSNAKNLENMLFVLDGDMYKTDDDKEKQIKKMLTGNANGDDEKRKSALSKIKQFALSDGEKPEKRYHALICALKDKDNELLSQEQKEIVNAAIEIVNPLGDSHKFLDDIIHTMNFDRGVGLDKLAGLISLSDQWQNITKDIREWFLLKKPSVIEQN